MVSRGMFFGMILGCMAFCTQAKSFTDPGSLWLGGTAGIISQKETTMSTSINYFYFSPVFRIFPAKNFFIGPAFDGTIATQDDYQSSSLGFGAEFGCAFSINDKVVPYFKSGFQYISNNSKYNDSFDREHESSIDGFAISIMGGAMIKLFDIVGIQIEPKFVFRNFDGERQNEYGINIGFCAIGDKAAVSVLGKF